MAEIGAYAGPEPAVVAAVSDLLPVLRQRAQETEDNRDVPAELGQGTHRDRVLPAAAAGQLRRA